ncbi:MAG: hypothetical protein RLZZ437_3505 [Pseudomonadota bacterium]|jgi:Ca2+-binding RTX toxin-like protein
MPLSANEQYLLELINRGRLDPVAEAARYGIDLNANLAAGTISTEAKQVLAPNALLESAAIKHSQWMLATDIFSHTGANGSTLGTRATAEGYQWNLVGENIAVWGTSGTLNPTAAIDAHHKGLFLSAGHRTNLMHDTFSEVGLAQEVGKFAFSGGAELNASMLTELFGHSAGNTFLTGVAYTDTNKNGFYSVGEGKALTQFKVGGATAVSEAAGGYAINVSAGGEQIVTGQSGRTKFTVAVDFSDGNVKLDIVDGKALHSSADIRLISGFANVELMGRADLSAVGNRANNIINGNVGSNVLVGNNGNDVIDGRAGNDWMTGDIGNDRLTGGDGHDALFGGVGKDYLVGGSGNDRINGGLGADRFVFSNSSGADVIEDFRLSEKDRLMINDDLWVGRMTAAQVINTFARTTAEGVVFDFGDGDSLTLAGLTTTSGLASGILFI